MVGGRCSLPMVRESILTIEYESIAPFTANAF